MALIPTSPTHSTAIRYMASLRVKDGVSIRGVRPEIILLLAIAADVYGEHGADECVVTSCTDGSHSKGSLHYVGLAVDLRIWPWQDNADALRDVVSDLQHRLGTEYDVVLETSHIHIEYQPESAP